MLTSRLQCCRVCSSPICHFWQTVTEARAHSRRSPWDCLRPVQEGLDWWQFVWDVFRKAFPHTCPTSPSTSGPNGWTFSHFQPVVIQRAAKERVIMFTLHPHITHLTQPLYKGCFGPLKQHWRNVCWEYITSSAGRVITRYALFRIAWEKAMTMSNIVTGFRTTGVYPLDPSACSFENVSEKDRLGCESLAERSGLHFIPLYNPARTRVLSSTSYCIWRRTNEPVSENTGGGMHPGKKGGSFAPLDPPWISHWKNLEDKFLPHIC